MKTLTTSEKNGSILVMIMVLMVVFSLMTLALLQLGAFNETETIKQLRITQAHWLAEAGLERALSWVAASQTYRDSLTANWTTYSAQSLGNGQYTIEIRASSDSNIVIRSTGTTTNGGISSSSTVQLGLNYLPGIAGAFVGLNQPGHTHLNEDVLVVDGDIYRNGTMDIDGSVDSERSAYATDPPITGDGEYNENYIPPPAPPIIDEDGTFANLLTDAAAAAQTNTLFSGTLSGGETILVKGDLTLSDGISGSGTLVVSGNLILDGNNKSIADNIDVVVGGNIIVSQHTSFGDHVEIFSQDGNISLQHDIDGGTVAFIAKNGSLGHIEPDYDNTLGVIDTSGLLTSGHSIGDQNPSKPSFSGVFYAEYDIILRHKADFYGSIIAGRNMDIGHSSNEGSMRVTYDPSVYDEDWQFEFNNEIVIVNSDWQEL